MATVASKWPRCRLGDVTSAMTHDIVGYSQNNYEHGRSDCIAQTRQAEAARRAAHLDRRPSDDCDRVERRRSHRHQDVPRRLAQETLCGFLQRLRCGGRLCPDAGCWCAELSTPHPSATPRGREDEEEVDKSA